MLIFLLNLLLYKLQDQTASVYFTIGSNHTMFIIVNYAVVFDLLKYINCIFLIKI